MPDGGLIRRRGAEVKARKAHTGQPVARHEPGPRVRQIAVRLHDQEFEHRDRVKRPAAAFDAVVIAEAFDELDPESLKIHGQFRGLKRVAAGADARQLLLKAEKVR